jgi:polyphosphate kinase
MEQYSYMDRELSWLSFNGRVLQEAKDPSVLLYDKIKFLAIFSSNMDEFFRVRVASLRSLLSLKQKSAKKLDFDPNELLAKIHTKVKKQQEEFGEIFRTHILGGLQEHSIEIVTERSINLEQREFVKNYFNEHVLSAAKPLYLGVGEGVPFLENQKLYLTCSLSERDISVAPGQHSQTKEIIALVPVPTNLCPRFLVLPKAGETHCIMFLDDVVRACLDIIFPHHLITEAHSIKLTRDAELYIEDEFAGDLLDKIKKALHRRNTGVPSRFLYDEQIPKKTLKYLRDYLDINKSDSIPGGRYHHFSDFFAFPNPGIEGVSSADQPPIASSLLSNGRSLFDVIREQDVLLYFPYHSYDPVVRLLQEAAADPDVSSIDITLYRVSSDSAVCRALIDAAKRGKTVNAFVEVKARFDEESNFNWAETLAKSGVITHFSIPGLKVHSKLLVISRNEDADVRRYAYLSTGNFNEKTARIYTDFGLFTADPALTEEAYRAFQFIIDRNNVFEPEHLLVAQLNMRSTINDLLKQEIKQALKGKKASITLKLNSLEDRKLIRRLYDASNAGVKITVIVRGICGLIPGVKGQSENIKVISIVDRYLEHPRVYLFHNSGKPLMYLSSADWMTRNMNRRIEVAFPLYNETARELVMSTLNLQLKDNCKARVINVKQNNRYVKHKPSEELVESQAATYDFIKAAETNPNED